MTKQSWLLLLTATSILVSCEKKLPDTSPASEKISGNSNKILICHGQLQGNPHTISINVNAWPAHLAHGDVRLDDQDDDGFVPVNACGYGNMGDCDDNNAAINPAATEICGNQVDENCDGLLDNNCTVTICNQTWMLKNLDVSTYRNGDPIPQVTNDAQWASLTTGAWCWYNNDSATYAALYGKLYNWYAVNDPRGLAPSGWHIPTREEWTELADCLGGSGVAGGAMKEAGYAHWFYPNTGATNSSGFTGLPAGFRYSTDGKFGGLGTETYWWSTTPCCPDNTWICYLSFYVPNHVITNSPHRNGISVRCIKN